MYTAILEDRLSDLLAPISMESTAVDIQTSFKVEQFTLPQTGKDIEDIEYGDLLKRLLQELLLQNTITKKHIDHILYLIDIGKIELKTSVPSKILVYVQLLMDEIRKILKRPTAKVLAFYHPCDQKIYIFVDKTIFSSLISYIFNRISPQDAYVFYIVLTHEFTHMIAQELPKQFMAIFRQDLLTWYKVFKSYIDPYDLYINPPSKIVDTLFVKFEKYAHRKLCGNVDARKLWNEGVVKAWFKSERLSRDKHGVIYLDLKDIPEGMYRDMVHVFYTLLLKSYTGEMDDQLFERAHRLLVPAFDMAYSAIKVPYPDTFFYQELFYPSEISSVAVMFRRELADKVWNALRFIH